MKTKADADADDKLALEDGKEDLAVGADLVDIDEDLLQALIRVVGGNVEAGDSLAR